MKNAKLIICVVSATLAAITPAQTQAPQAGDAVPVTVENFIRAESDLHLSAVALKKGGFGKFSIWADPKSREPWHPVKEILGVGAVALSTPLRLA
jgi:hypothetical protein